MRFALLLVAVFVASLSEARVEPFMRCTSDSENIKAIDLYVVNFKDVPNIHSGALRACTFDPKKDGGLGMTITFPASGSRINGPDSQPIVRWVAAVVVDANGDAKIYSQYSDYVSRSVSVFGQTSPCTQGMFMSEDREILDFQTNEPIAGVGNAIIGSSKITLRCR